MREGPHQFLVHNTKVADFYTPLTADESPITQFADTMPRLTKTDSLGTALRLFDQSSQSRLPVLDRLGGTHVGWAGHIDSLRRFNTILVATSREEHR